MSQQNMRTWVALLVTAGLEALVLFVTAGTVLYWQVWNYLAAYLLPSILITLDLMKRDPALLGRRMRGGPTAEKQKSQRIIMLFAALGFIALFVVSALDHRYSWTGSSVWIVAAGDAAMMAGLYIVFLVFRENPFASATVEVAVEQRVVSTGPYAILRHPMYAGGMLYLLGTPLSLNSVWGLLAFAAIVPVLIWRLIDEERMLARTLPGYSAYLARVRWRLVPGVF